MTNQSDFSFPRYSEPRKEDDEFYTIYVCDECGYPNIAKFRTVLQYSPLTQRDEPSRGELIEWIPEHATDHQFTDVPIQVAASANEAFRCYSIQAYRATVIMARGVLEAIVNDKIKDPSKPNGHEMTLNEKIKALVSDGTFSKRLGESADAIKNIGNGSTHNAFEAVEEDEANTILIFLELVLEEVYQHEARFERLHAANERLDERKKQRLGLFGRGKRKRSGH